MIASHTHHQKWVSCHLLQHVCWGESGSLRNYRGGNNYLIPGWISKFAIFLFLLGFFNPPERMTASTTDFLVDNQLALILKVWPVCYCGNCSYHSVFLKCLMNSIVLECRSQVTVVLLWRSVVSCIGFFSHTSVVELTSPPSECREEATV